MRPGIDQPNMLGELAAAATWFLCVMSTFQNSVNRHLRAAVWRCASKIMQTRSCSALQHCALLCLSRAAVHLCIHIFNSAMTQLNAAISPLRSEKESIHRGWSFVSNEKTADGGHVTCSHLLCRHTIVPTPGFGFRKLRKEKGSGKCRLAEQVIRQEAYDNSFVFNNNLPVHVLTNPRPMGLNIVIVGSGLAGLAAAAYLRKEHKVTVLEKNYFEFDRNDFGISVVCNAYGLLQKLGIDDTKLDMAVMTKIWQRSASNQELFTADFDTRKMYGTPSVLTRRSHLQRELNRLATDRNLEGEPANIIEDFKVREVRCDVGTVIAEDGRCFTGDIIVGADGIHSVVRNAVLSESGTCDREAPATTHDLLAYMAQISIARLEGNTDMAFFSTAIHAAGLANWQPPGETPGPVTKNKRRILGYHISPREFQLVGYCPEEEFAEQFDHQKASIIKGIPATRAKAAFHDFAESLTSLYDHHISGPGTVEVWRIRDVEPLSRWSRGKALLIGDAAHAIVPHAGQGYNLAVEDAEALGHLLMGASSPDDIQTAIKKFVRIRKARAEDVALSSRHMGGLLTDGERENLGPFDRAAFGKRVYGYQGAEAELDKLRGESQSMNIHADATAAQDHV